MGLIIKKKLNGMSWWAKTSLVLLLTMATTVFMYQGWYLPKDSQAATLTYYVSSSTTAVGVDGSCNLPTGTTSTTSAAAATATTPVMRGEFLTTAGTAARWTPSATPTIANSSYVKVYGPVYAADTDISGITANFALRGSTTSNTFTAHLYDYDPAGTAQNKTLVASSSIITTTGGTTTTAYTPTYTVVGTGRVAAGHRLMCEVVRVTAGSVNSTRIAYNANTATTGSWITVTETTVAANSTTIAAGTPVQTAQTFTVNTASPSARFVNAFGLSVSSGSTDSISSANVTVGGTGTAVINSVEITSLDEATVYGTSSTNVSNVYTIPLSPSLAAPITTPTQYRVRIVPKGSGVIANGSYAVTANISAITSSLGNTVVDNDTADATITFSVVNVQLPSAIIDCGGCHGYPSGTHSIADNTVAVGRANGQFPGSHNVHVNTSGMICADCHNTLPATNNHADGNVTMGAIRGGTYSKGTVPVANTFTAGTCNNTTCHGVTSTLSWGTSYASYDTCTKCHGTMSAAPATNVQKAPTGAAAHAVHLSTTIAPVVACSECHENVVSTVTAGHMDGTKTILFNGPIAYGVPQSVTPTNSLAGCSTTWCHGGDTTLIPQNKPTNRANPVWGTTFGTTSTLGLATGTASTNTGSGRCAKCHGFPPATSNHVGAALTGASSCNSCHSHVTTTGTFSNASLHIDGKVDASGGSCTACHAGTGSGVKNGRVAVVDQFGAGNSHHVQTGAAVTTTACYSCHWEANSDGSINSTYHTSAANQPVNLVVYNTTARPTTYTLNTTSVEYLSGGTAASTRANLALINNHCIGCHNVANSGTAKFAGDTAVPAKYAWETGLSIAARYSQTGTTSWGKFTGNATVPKTATKAFSAHGQATKNQRGWSTVADTYPNAVATSNILCFDCHNSHGSSTTAAAGITSSYSSATGRRKGGILKDVQANKGGYTVTYKPSLGGSAAQRNVYNSGAALCFDCHNNATPAAASTPWGYTTTFGFTPPAAQGTGRGVVGLFDTPYFGQAGMNFISTLTYTYKAGMAANQGGHFGASTSKGAFTGVITKRAYDPATPTGTVIQGLCTPCHDPHGVSPTVATAAAYSVPLLKGTWVTSPYKQDAAPTTAQRGGGSRITGNLVGAGVVAYRLDQNTMTAAGTGTTGWLLATNATTLQTTNDTQFAGLCIGCHLKTNLNDAAAASSANWKTKGRIHNSVKGWASTAGGNAGNKIHSYTCSKCHAPHNSRLPRLLVTNCLDIKHKGRAASGGNMAAAFSTGNSSGSGTGRFPGGGSSLTTSKSSSQTSPWFFSTGNATASPACHDSATAGGATYSTTAELWNTKSLW